MPFLLPLSLMLMQVGIDPRGGQVPGVPEELRNRPPRKAPPGVEPAPPAIAVCLDTAKTDPAKARALAQEWVGRTSGEQQATGQHCLGIAAAGLGDWPAAGQAFLAARDLGEQARFRARMGALAGTALLAQGKAADALAALDVARPEAAGDADLGGAIATERAMALVDLKRPKEAATALAEARGLRPYDPQVWLLSATLSRRGSELTSAQEQIERAAALAPTDLDIGIEAGLIAALGGREAAARKSFESVLAADPRSPQAEVARHYLAQLKR